MKARDKIRVINAFTKYQHKVKMRKYFTTCIDFLAIIVFIFLRFKVPFNQFVPSNDLPLFSLISNIILIVFIIVILMSWLNQIDKARIRENYIRYKIKSFDINRKDIELLQKVHIQI